MNIEWIGHAAFKITSDQGIKILTDPYERNSYGGAVKYDEIRGDFDIITISHSHSDHSFTENFTNNPLIIKDLKKKNLGDVTITAIESFHDNAKGKGRGKNLIFIYEVSGARLAHLGDLGHDLDNETIKKLIPIDILLIPTGGVFTIDASIAYILISKINPVLAIPMHYKTKKLAFNIDPIDTFKKIAANAKTTDKSKIEYDRTKKEPNGILIMSYSH